MDYKELKQKRKELKLKYFEDREKIIDKKYEELDDLKDEYLLNDLVLKEPLKEEEHKLKIEKRKRNRELNDAPRRKVIAEIGNSITHGVGALLGILFLVLMILKAKDELALMAAIIYGTCFTLQMTFSCLYHAFRGGTEVKRLFRRFDYSSIYLQIGGTFAPLFLIYVLHEMGGTIPALSLFISQWTVIVIGITFISIFGPGRLKWLHFTLYFLIGWSGLMFLPIWFTNQLPLALWILGGGIVYTLGMIPFAALKHYQVSHFIWHFVVLLGAILMWVGEYLYVF